MYSFIEGPPTLSDSDEDVDSVVINWKQQKPKRNLLEC